jgi:hypothetical protein
MFPKLSTLTEVSRNIIFWWFSCVEGAKFGFIRMRDTEFYVHNAMEVGLIDVSVCGIPDDDTSLESSRPHTAENNLHPKY